MATVSKTGRRSSATDTLAGIPEGNRRLTSEEAARNPNIPRATLEKWRCRGDGPPFEKAGDKHVRYRAADLESHLASRRFRSTSEVTDRQQAKGRRVAAR